MKNIQTFTNEVLANEVLEYYENFLLRCNYIVYIAVVKEEINFKIEIGITSDGKGIVEYDNCKKLSSRDIFFGNFHPNTIPSYFPIPSQFIYHLRFNYKTNDSIKFNFINSSFLINETNNADFKKDFIIDKARSRKSYLIKNKNGTKTTMGATFRLLQFPDDLFGITNHHLFSYQDARLGDKVYDKNNNKIGESFWVTKDYDKEVAIIKICKESIKDYSNFDSMLPVGTPKIGMKVIQNGMSNTSSENETSIIRSINATIRKVETNNAQNWALYKHQLLMDEFTVNGDSGSLIISIDDVDNRSIIGLNFAKFAKPSIENSVIKKYTIANNINRIFDHNFSHKQEVLSDNIDDGYITTTFIQKFILENHKI